jgi:hypothetical protein
MMCERKVMSVTDEGDLERIVPPKKAANTRVNLTYTEKNHFLRAPPLA